MIRGEWYPPSLEKFPKEVYGVSGVLSGRGEGPVP